MNEQDEQPSWDQGYADPAERAAIIALSQCRNIHTDEMAHALGAERINPQFLEGFGRDAGDVLVRVIVNAARPIIEAQTRARVAEEIATEIEKSFTGSEKMVNRNFVVALFALIARKYGLESSNG